MEGFTQWLAGDWHWVAGFGVFFVFLVVGLFLKSRFDDGSGRWNIGD
jgi:hypothetical protein